MTTTEQRLRFWQSQPTGDDSWRGEWADLIALLTEAADTLARYEEVVKAARAIVDAYPADNDARLRSALRHALDRSAHRGHLTDKDFDPDCYVCVPNAAPDTEEPDDYAYRQHLTNMNVHDADPTP